MISEPHTCWKCGEDILGEQIWLDAGCSVPARGEQVRFDSSGVYLAAYVECPGCREVIGGEIKIDPTGYIDYAKDDPHEEVGPTERQWTVFNDDQEATITGLFIGQQSEEGQNDG